MMAMGQLELWRKQRGPFRAEHFQDVPYDKADADFWNRTSEALRTTRCDDGWTFLAAVDGERPRWREAERSRAHLVLVA